MYYSNVLSKVKGDIKATWRELRPIIGKQRDKDPIKCDFEINNHKVSDPSDIANAFSDYFTNVGKQLQSSIPSSKKTFEEYSAERETKTIFLNPTTENEIGKIISELKDKTSVGYDGISNYLLNGLGIAY